MLPFGIAIDWIAEGTGKTNANMPWVDGKCLEDLDLADDIVSLSDTLRKLQRETTWQKLQTKQRLKVNYIKIKQIPPQNKNKKPFLKPRNQVDIYQKADA